MSAQDVQRFLQAALECSVYHAPRNPGLTYQEIVEAGKRVGFQDGEIGDAIPHVTTQYFGRDSHNLMPNGPFVATWGFLALPMEPEYRNSQAFDFVYSELNALVRSMGNANAILERDILVERAVSQNITRLDIEAAITISLLSGQLTEKQGLLRFKSNGEHLPLPSVQRRQTPSRVNHSEVRENAYRIVKDIVDRRSDGRPKHAEPLDEFAWALERLKYAPFRVWWKQIVLELRHSSPQASPVSVLVLAAALVEGVLTFVVRHARNLGLGTLASKTFDENPRTWTINDLVNSAAAGREDAILDGPVRQRAESLMRNRQRIHAGRMLSEFPQGVADLRPEEAREAIATAEQVVRCVLDWLEKYPPS